MEAGLHTPLLDCFRRGEVTVEMRLLAARGVLAPRAHEQIALLTLLVGDPEPKVRAAAEATIGLLPREPLAAFLARGDVSDALREFFAARGVQPSAAPAPDVDAPLVEAEVAPVDAEGALVEDPDASKQGTVQKLALMSVVERMRVAMKGTREERAVLIRDPNKLVSVSVLSSPKLTETEIEGFAKMTSVSEETLRIVGTTRAWIKAYGVVSALARNPKTPLAVSLNLVQRLNERDLKILSLDRNIQEPLKLAVRKRLVSPDRR